MSDDAMNIDSPAPLHRSSSASAPKPKGILKNPSSDVTSTLAHPSVNTPNTNTSNTSSDVNGHQRDSTANITAANTALNTPSGSQPIVPVQPSSTSAQETAGDVPIPPAGMTAAQRLHWDEASLEAAAAQGGGKMKITEPKTPYVRYNAELDRVENMEDIPNFELSGGGGGGGSETSRSPRSVISDLGEPAEGPSSGALGLGNPPASAATTADSSRRPSAPSRSSSRSVSIASGGHSRRSSRASEQPSVDFDTVPTTAGGGVAQGLGGSALDTEDGEDEDDISTWDPEKREQHERFAALRNRHYSNEAEAMKRAAELMKQEDEDAEDEDAAEVEETKADGIEEDQDDEDGEGGGNGASGTNGRQPNGITRVPPPVPAVPAQYRS